MRIKDRFFLSFTLVILLIISACEDPSSVGLVDDAGGTPIVSELPITEFEASATSGVNSATDRMLIGQVEDPVLGDFMATGYLDFTLSNRPSDEYLNGDVGALRLTLTLDSSYAYGALNEEITVDVYEIASAFEIVTEAEDLPMDTVEPLFQFSVTPGSRTVTAAFPDSWLQENNALLRPTIPEVFSDNAFNTDFHGLRFVPSDGNAFIRVLANTTLSFLQGVVYTNDGADSVFVNYLAGNTITAYDKATEPVIPDNRALLQSDVGSNIKFNLELSELTEFSGVNRAALEMRFDTTAFAGATNFVRPNVGSLTMVGIVADSLENSVEALEACGVPNVNICILSNSRISDTATLTFDEGRFREEIERRSLGMEVFKHYEIRFPTPNAANAIIIHDMDSPENPPSFVLTYTELN